MYAEERRRSPGSQRLRKIERVAREFLDASRMAYAHDPGTAPHERAITQAETAALRLGDLVSIVDPLEPVLKAAEERVRRAPTEPNERDLKRWAMGKRR
jgi:hypothetical protein